MAKTWLDKWNPEDDNFWESEGKKIAWRTLWITTFTLILSFATWFMMSAIVVKLPSIGFDGNRFTPYFGIAHVCHIKGDGRFKSIAAASILAKTHRDAMMIALHNSHPDFNSAVNKGYPTAEHQRALRSLGPTEHHRRTFRLDDTLGTETR